MVLASFSTGKSFTKAEKTAGFILNSHLARLNLVGGNIACVHTVEDNIVNGHVLYGLAGILNR
jgi:hypothetical protein